MVTTIKCLAVDDHPAVRQGLALLLGGAPDIELVDAVHSGEEVMDAVRRHHPGVVIVDVRLPGMDGISTVKRLAADAPDASSVVFSAYGDKRLLSRRDLRRRARLRDEGLAAGRPAARDPHRARGDAFVDPSLSPALLMTQEVADAPLSEREREVLQLLAEGLHTEEVARRDRPLSRDGQVRHEARHHQARGRRPRPRRGHRAAQGADRVATARTGPARPRSRALTSIAQSGDEAHDPGDHEDQPDRLQVDARDRVADGVPKDRSDGSNEYRDSNGHNRECAPISGSTCKS